MTRCVATIAAAVFLSLPSWTAAQGGQYDITRLIETADPALQVEWALRFAHAEGVPRDYDRAIRLLCAAARRGSAEAQYEGIGRINALFPGCSSILRWSGGRQHPLRGDVDLEPGG